MLPRQLDPATIHPTKENILAVQYTRPAMVGSLHIPAAYDKDGSWNWWECVKAGPGAAKVLGVEMQPGDIFRTPWRPGTDLGAEDSQGRRLFIVPCQVERNVEGRMQKELNITGIIFKEWEG